MARMGDGQGIDRDLAVILRIAEELTNKPAGCTADAMTLLLEHLVRYRRAQARLNETCNFGLADPRNLDVFEAAGQLAERYTTLARLIRDLRSGGGPPFSPALPPPRDR